MQKWRIAARKKATNQVVNCRVDWANAKKKWNKCWTTKKRLRPHLNQKQQTCQTADYKTEKSGAFFALALYYFVDVVHYGPSLAGLGEMVGEVWFCYNRLGNMPATKEN